MAGSLSGANYWVGLHQLLALLLVRLQTEGLWTRHACNKCTQDVVLNEQHVKVNAAVADGLTAVRLKLTCTQAIKPQPIGINVFVTFAPLRGVHNQVSAL